MANISNYEIIRGLYTRTANEAAVLNAYYGKIITADEYELILGKTVPEKTLDGAKSHKINITKNALATYLEENPLVSSCHNGTPATYTITEDKQNMFSRKFSTHMAKKQAGMESTMTWNAAGQPCEPWTDEEALQFMAEADAYITPLVSYQQHLEVEINACTTVEEVEAIKINYASVHAVTSDDTETA